jgi:drug/metabolite transporter (DMT)-like permease
MLVSCIALSCLAAMGRLLGSYDVNSFQTVFCRLFFAFIILLPLALHAGIGAIATTQIKIYVLRSISGIIAMWMWFYAVTLIPIGEQTAFSFLAPLFTTIGATLFLGEVVRLRRWIAILIGFIGALIIIRPGIIELSLGHVVAIATALAFGCSMLILKHLTRKDDPLIIVFISHLIMMPLALLPALYVWEWPQFEVWMILIATGPVAVIGHVTLTKAYKLADASFVAGVDYARLPFAVLFGWILFGELSDIWTWIGASVIFGSSFYVIRREMNEMKETAKDPLFVEKG